MAVSADFQRQLAGYGLTTAEILYRMPAIESLLEDMDQILQQSELVTPERIKARPWYLRVAGDVLRLFAMWM